MFGAARPTLRTLKRLRGGRATEYAVFAGEVDGSTSRARSIVRATYWFGSERC
jgi:hypothetical protein